jgi:transposase
LIIRKDVPHAHTTPSGVPASRGRPGAPGRQTLIQLAKDLGISRSSLQNWINQAGADENGGTERLTSAEKKELAELRRRNRQLEMENDTLKRAAA